MKRIAIIADDLTSACDGAAPFVAAGCRAHVVFDPPRRGPLAAGVTAVDTDSRSKSAAQAARCAAAVTAALAGADVLFKTVDSTLRGHLVAEIDAALAVSGRRIAVLAPAFPAQGRTTVAGVQHLDGQPVDRTWFGQDPGHPVPCADLLRLFPGAVPMPAGQGAEFAGRVGAARYVVADAGSDAGSIRARKEKSPALTASTLTSPEFPPPAPEVSRRWVSPRKKRSTPGVRFSTSTRNC